MPNVPFLTAAWEISRADLLKELAVKAVIMTTQSKPFVKVSAHSFLWGYDDELIEKSKAWSFSPPKFDKFGMLTTVWQRSYIFSFEFRCVSAQTN